jgi:translation elongation factor EF-Tu-like GTPase
MMKKLLEQALAGKDAPKAMSGRLRKDKKRGGVLAGPKESGRLAEKKEAKQETDSEAESELESLSDSDSEAGKGKGGQ